MGRIPLPKNNFDLWAYHKYSVMARDVEAYRQIGPGVASGEFTFEALCLILVEILRKPPGQGCLVNALDHMGGYVSGYGSISPNQPGPARKFREIQRLALAHKTRYLCRSTAIGELGAWLSNTDHGPGGPGIQPPWE